MWASTEDKKNTVYEYTWTDSLSDVKKKYHE